MPGLRRKQLCRSLELCGEPSCPCTHRCIYSLGAADGKSGGQKEKLAYTILAASLAYQFGLEWGVVKSRDFRFAVIDEAFGRGSDVSTRYALELFAKLGLQLLIVTPLQKVRVIDPYVKRSASSTTPPAPSPDSRR